jgi:hypothetical protein
MALARAQRSAARARTIVGVAATLAMVGIVLSIQGDAGVGAFVTVPSLIGLVYGLHRLGRSGPDRPERRV